ncbi:MAG: nicotinate (nicotinamide) nucleotide adenylyltransferase [Candidatus Dormibacteria bacterium]
MSLVAVLGGTFDPIHGGHIAIAQQAADALEADEAWLIPAGIPPHRGSPGAPARHRLAMARAAVEGHDRLRVLDLEMHRNGPSYTIDTLATLTRRHPGTDFWLVVGADAAPTVSAWHRGEELLATGLFAVVNRSGIAAPEEADVRGWGFDPARTRIVSLDSPPISSSEVRARVAAGAEVDDLVPAAVAALISQLGFYRPAIMGGG